MVYMLNVKNGQAAFEWAFQNTHSISPPIPFQVSRVSECRHEHLGVQQVAWSTMAMAGALTNLRAIMSTGAPFPKKGAIN